MSGIGSANFVSLWLGLNDAAELRACPLVVITFGCASAAPVFGKRATRFDEWVADDVLALGAGNAPRVTAYENRSPPSIHG